MHPRLTLISAPNSYGKTSVAEALEFLLFGVTSKVQGAHSVEEYKDSYRNRHFPAGRPIFVEAKCLRDDRTTLTIRRILKPDGATRCLVDGTEVDDWPFGAQLRLSATPFVIQHALKELLLVAPNDRFLGFARILGLNDVDAMHKAITSLCTKPEVSLPPKAAKYLEGLSQLEVQLAAIASLRPVVLSLRKGEVAFDDTLQQARARAAALTGEAGADILVALARKRDEIAKLVYEGDPRVVRLTPDKLATQQKHQGAIELVATAIFVQQVADLAQHDALSRLQQQADFLKTGLQYLLEDPTHCPLCGLPDEGGNLDEHIRSRHDAIVIELKAPAESDLRKTLIKQLANARAALISNWTLLRAQVADLMDVLDGDKQKRIRDLLAQDESGAFDVLTSVATSLRNQESEVESTAELARNAAEECELRIKAKDEQVAHVEALVSATQSHLAALNSWTQSVYECVDQVLLTRPAFS